MTNAIKINNLCITVVCTFLVIHCDGSCIHDKINHPMFVRGSQSYASTRRSDGGFSPIRVTFDNRFVAQSTSISTDQKNYITQLTSFLQSRLQSLLKVQPVVGNLSIPQSCTSRWVSGPAAGKHSNIYFS